MATPIPPAVRLIVVCDIAEYHAPANAWDLRNPRTVFQLPPGARFPFRTTELSIYVQLTGGVGTWDLAVEMLQVRDNGAQRFVGTSGVRRGVEFSTSNRLIPILSAFVLRPVGFCETGVYVFRVVAVSAAGSDALAGETTSIRVLDSRSTI